MLKCKFIVSFEHFIKAIIIVSRSLANGEKNVYVKLRDMEGEQWNKTKYFQGGGDEKFHSEVGQMLLFDSH